MEKIKKINILSEESSVKNLQLMRVKQASPSQVRDEGTSKNRCYLGDTDVQSLIGGLFRVYPRHSPTETWERPLGVCMGWSGCRWWVDEWCAFSSGTVSQLQVCWFVWVTHEHLCSWRVKQNPTCQHKTSLMWSKMDNVGDFWNKVWLNLKN